MKEKIVLIGGGGHCKVVIDAIRNGGRFDIFGIVDSNIKIGDRVLGVPVKGDDSELKKIFIKGGVKNAFISVGSTGDSSVRVKLAGKAEEVGFNLPVIIHPSSVIAEDVYIGKGTFVAALVAVNTGTKIGNNVILNTRSSIDHDCLIGDFVHVAPGATLSGGVRIDEGIHIGTGATVSHGSYLDNKIKDHKKVRAGSVVYYSPTTKNTYVSWPHNPIFPSDEKYLA